MSKGFKFFLIFLLISFPFWGWMNVLEEKLENFLFWQEMAGNQKVLTVFANQQNLEQKLRKLKPFKKSKVENLKIGAQSAISVLFQPKIKAEKILFEKEINKKLNIASLTKLMTAYVVLENYDLNQITKISITAIKEEEDFGNLKPGEILRVKDLLYILLMESSNDAAQALAEVIGRDNFVELMNLEAKNLGLENTFFANPTGLDPDQIENLGNYSTVKDLAKFIQHLLNLPLIWEILSTPEFELYSFDGKSHHKLQNTNELLHKNLGLRIVGGKTGWTPRAKECLLLVLEAPKKKGVLINIILGSESRFEEMENLVNWVHEAYHW